MTSFVVSSGVTSSGLTVNSGETGTVQSGGTASGTTVNSGGTLTDLGTASGTVRFLPHGAGRATAASGLHRIVVALKPAGVPPLRNESGAPLAFPRPGSKKFLENDRVVVWERSLQEFADAMAASPSARKSSLSADRRPRILKA